MTKFSLNTLIIGTVLSAPPLVAAHSSGQASSTVMHSLTSPDHIAVFAIAGSVALAVLMQRGLAHLRKVPSRRR